uniref:Apple domain-containing protein n=1 Tax=Romanomermis culicivorax TaxID=13658 RepID=A0A915KWE7_ROMCU
MHMLEILHLTPVGRHHCGLDDSTNVANIVVALIQKGCVFEYSSKNLWFTSSVYYFVRHDVMYTQCSGKNRIPIFLRAERMTLFFDNATKYLNVDLDKCTDICLSKNSRDIPSSCNSFSFTNTGYLCSISTQNAQPFGSSVLSSISQQQTTFHQKICLTMQYKCISPVIFDWFPQHVLIGFANEVKTQISLTDCLSLCLQTAMSAPVNPKRVCKSVMYFYDTKECILNNVDKTVRPDLFVDDTQGYVVDYFENRCTPLSPVTTGPSDLGAKPVVDSLDCVAESSSSLQYTNAVNKQLTTLKATAYTEFFQCKFMCDTNKVSGDGGSLNSDVKIMCRGFNYDNSNKLCSLDHNKDGDSDVSKPLLQDKSGVNYYEKICLNYGFKCTNLAANSAFIRYPMRVLIGHSREVYHFSTVSDCLDSCLNSKATNGFRCSSAMYYYETGECIVNAVNKQANPGLFSADMQGFIVDYFENNCESDDSFHYYTPHQTSVTPYDNFFITPARNLMDNSAHKLTIPLLVTNAQLNTKEIFKSSENSRAPSTILGEFSDYSNSVADFTLPPSSLPLLQQRSRELNIRRNNLTSSSGENLKVDSTEQTLDILIIPAPTRSLIIEGNGNKNGGNSETSVSEKIDPSPSLKAECYQNFVRVILTSGKLISGILSSKSLDRRTENTPAHCQRSYNNSNLVSENKQAYTIVKDNLAGETEIYNITCDFSNLDDNDKPELLDCDAESVGGVQKSQPSLLKLFNDGCPENDVYEKVILSPVSRISSKVLESKLSVFRFDGSKNVRIQCSVDICLKTCSP